MKISRRVVAIYNRILGIFMAVSCVIVIAIMLITGYEVVMRYAGFDVNLSWPTEIIDNLLIYMTFLGTAWLLKQNGHISIDVLYNYQGPKTRLLIDLFTSFLGIFTCLIMTWYSGKLAIDDFARGITEVKSMAAPRGLIIGIMPVGFFMLFIEFARQFFQHLTNLRSMSH